MDTPFIDHLRGRAAEERRFSKAVADPVKAAMHLELAQRYEAVLNSYQAVYPNGRSASPL
jgi:hypothetical protein